MEEFKGFKIHSCKNIPDDGNFWTQPPGLKHCQYCGEKLREDPMTTRQEMARAILDSHFRSYGMTYELRLVDEITAALDRAYADGLEAAAKVADEIAKKWEIDMGDRYVASANEAAVKIRALKDAK